MGNCAAVAFIVSKVLLLMGGGKQGPRSKANRVEIMIVIQSLGAASVETYGEEWENQCGCPSQLIK